MSNDINRMITDIEREVTYTSHMIGRKVLADRVMQVMSRVPRDQFVPPELRAYAFANGPLTIGHGQTISQPYIVALMTDLLELEPDYRILEIGTGSGYQTAILAELVEHVYTMELIPDLSDKAEHRLQELGYNNISCQVGNGYEGWQEHAPYDGIIVTAAAAYIPPSLIEQLKSRRKLVIPVGQAHMPQELVLVDKDAEGTTHTRILLDVAFVPLRQGLMEE